MISLLCREEGAKAPVFLGLLRQCGKRKSPAFEHFSAPARPPINIPRNIGLPWLRRPLAAPGSDQFMQPVHDHLLRVDATIWLTIGDRCDRRRRLLPTVILSISINARLSFEYPLPLLATGQ
jgi:hypothetical protein